MVVVDYCHLSVGAMGQSRGIGHRFERSRDVSVAVYRSRIGRYAK